VGKELIESRKFIDEKITEKTRILGKSVPTS
jgi:hypothetical protein